MRSWTQGSTAPYSKGALAEELRAAYGALGADEEENDVELFLPAQIEVLNSE
jgi:hypothetical protein